MAEQSCQFIVAMHSPILMALPGAKILSFDEGLTKDVKYEDVEHVSLTKPFLDNPSNYLHHL
jgi:predicted ATPase